MASVFRSIEREKKSLSEIIPVETERVFTELGRRVNREIISGESSKFKGKAAIFNKVLNTPEKCLQCGISFLPKINFLYRDCKMHIGSLVYKNYQLVYSCCDGYKDSPGCVSCMHVSRPEMYERIRVDPYNSFVEISKILVDSDAIEITKEIIVDYPKAFISQKRIEQIAQERNPNDKIRAEDWVYRINMVVIFPAKLS